jgi:cytochrome c peroxidase
MLLLAALDTPYAQAPNSRLALGERLFDDTRFSNPAGDLEAGCATCHAREDPQGYRAFTEPRPLSWHPWRDADPGRTTLRNTTSLIDMDVHPRIHYDGEFATLEEQAEKTLTGRNLGWLPNERDEAYAHIRQVMETDATYVEAVEVAYGVALSKLNDAAMVKTMADALAEFMRSLKTEFDSPYDRFIAANAIDAKPDTGETPKVYGARILGQVESIARSGEIHWVAGFGETELAGYKIFLRTDANEQTGNCVACHVPPYFSDFQFRNTGVTQLEYDHVNGSGAFSRLAIPTYSEVERPAKVFFSRPDKEQAGVADLGYWNFAKPETSPLYRAEDSPAAFLKRTVATFKTPSLRHLGATNPYMHSGAYPTVEAALDQKIHAAFLARLGQLRNGDEEMKGVHLIRQDIPALFAFLNALNDQIDPQLIPSPLPGGMGDPADSPYRGR